MHATLSGDGSEPYPRSHDNGQVSAQVETDLMGNGTDNFPSASSAMPPCGLSRDFTVSHFQAPAGTSSGPHDEKRKQEHSQSKPEKSDKRRKAQNLDLSIPTQEDGFTSFNDNDVLSGRGGGTNVHPGNRRFRDLINSHRCAYLKARKNDKPDISRAIVKAIRDSSGRFLKRDEQSGLWFELSDDAAREKTSQALRQRAPEMRKIMFESEQDQARHEAEEQIRLRQQQLLLGVATSQPTTTAAGSAVPRLPSFILPPHFTVQKAPTRTLQGTLQGRFATNSCPKKNATALTRRTDTSLVDGGCNVTAVVLLGGGLNQLAPHGA